MIDLKTMIEFTGGNEGLRLKTYKCPAGKDTIGYGHNLTDLGLPLEIKDEINLSEDGWDNLEITESVAERIFEIDVRNAEKELKRIFIDFDTYSKNRQVALIDMMFNMGFERFSKFKKMIMAIKFNMWKLAANEAKYSRWYRQVTKRADRVITKLKDEKEV